MARVSTRLVIRRARLVRDPPVDGATVVVEAGLITRVALPGEPVVPEPGDWEIDADGRLVVPGCVDAHTHLAVGALLRFAGLPGRYPGSPRALRQGFRRPVEERLAPADVEALARAAALSALRAGTTTVFALERAMPGQELATLEAAERAVRAVGLRGLLAHGASDLGGAGRGRASARAAMDFASPRAADPLVRGMAGLDGLHATTRETLEALAEPAARFGIHASIGEDGSDLDRSWGLEQKWPVKLLHDAALLGRSTIVAHASTLSTPEAEAIRAADATLVMPMRAARHWGVDPASLDLAAVAEVPVALGTDGLFPDLAGEAVELTGHLRRRRSAPSPGPSSSRSRPGRRAPRWRASSSGRGSEPCRRERPPTSSSSTGARPPWSRRGGAETRPLLWAGAPASWVIVAGEVRLREGVALGVDPVEVSARAVEAARRALAD